VSSDATGNSASGVSSSASRRFTQTTFSATSSSSSAARGPASRGPVGGKPRAGLEDWPSIPSRAGSSAPKLDISRSYDPSPEVIRTGSWPYNYVSGGAAPARPARVGGQQPGLGNFANPAAANDARSAGSIPGAGASGGDKYFGSARSTLGARANKTSFTKSDAYKTDYYSNATTRYSSVSTATSTTSTTSSTGSSVSGSVSGSAASYGDGAGAGAGSGAGTSARLPKPQGRITGRGARRASSTVRVEDLGLNPLGPVPVLTVLAGAPAVALAVRKSPRMAVSERKLTATSYAPAYGDRGAAAAAAAAAGNALQAVAGAATVAGIYAAEKAREDVRRRAKERKAQKAERDAEREKALAKERERERRKAAAKAKEESQVSKTTTATASASSSSASTKSGSASARAKAAKAAEAERARARAEAEKKAAAQKELEARRREEAAATKARVKFEIAQKEKAIAEERARAKAREQREKARAEEKAKKERERAERAAKKASSKNNSARLVQSDDASRRILRSPRVAAPLAARAFGPGQGTDEQHRGAGEPARGEGEGPAGDAARREDPSAGVADEESPEESSCGGRVESHVAAPPDPGAGLLAAPGAEAAEARGEEGGEARGEARGEEGGEEGGDEGGEEGEDAPREVSGVGELSVSFASSSAFVSTRGVRVRVGCKHSRLHAESRGARAEQERPSRNLKPPEPFRNVEGVSFREPTSFADHFVANAVRFGSPVPTQAPGSAFHCSTRRTDRSRPRARLRAPFPRASRHTARRTRPRFPSPAGRVAPHGPPPRTTTATRATRPVFDPKASSTASNHRPADAP
jgi:hypothetical protein